MKKTIYMQIEPNETELPVVIADSINELAEKLDISREHLAKIETAKRTVSLDLLINIAEELKTKVKDLIDF